MGEILKIDEKAPAAEVDNATAPVGLDEFRQALRRLGGGVTIVASADGERQPCGLVKPIGSKT